MLPNSVIRIFVVRLPISSLNSSIPKVLTLKTANPGVNVKMLIPAQDDARIFANWITSGVFDALKHNYVRNSSITRPGRLQCARIPSNPNFSK